MTPEHLPGLLPSHLALRSRLPFVAMAALIVLLGLPGPTASAQETTFNVSVAAKNASHPNFANAFPFVYVIDGVQGKELTLKRGATYTFQMQNVPSLHPFYLSTSPLGAGVGEYTEGVTGSQVTGNGVLTFTPGENTPDLLYYQCGFHQQMGWKINVQDASTATSWMADLSGRNEVPANASDATGSISAQLSGSTLTVSGTFSGLSTPVNTSIRGGAHIHLAYPGENGGIAIELDPSLDQDGTAGFFDPQSNTFSLTPEQIEALQARRLYVNIHTGRFGGGEIRGQLHPASATTIYRAILSGYGGPDGSGSAGLGGVLAELEGNRLTISGAFTGLSSDFNATIRGGAHLHRAAWGANGGIALELVTALNPDTRSGAFAPASNTFDLTAEQLSDLQNGLYYVNVHTQAFPGGEIRGQLLPAQARVFEAVLNGANQTTPVASPATGSVVAMLDASGSRLTLAGSFKDLLSDFNAAIRGGAHIHTGAVGENGGIAIELRTTVGADNRSGSFLTAENTFDLTAEQIAALLEGRFYVNVHTMEHPAGEIRGQLLPGANAAPAAPVISAPADGTPLRVEGDPAALLTAEWAPVQDRNGNPLAYRWQLSADPAFATLLVDALAGGPNHTIDYGALGTLLANAGIGIDQSVTLYHRSVASDGSRQTAGAGSSLQVTRGVVTDVSDPSTLPESLRLVGAYPNPFNPATSIRFDLSEAAEVRVEIYDALGRRVQQTLPQSFLPGRDLSLRIDGSQLSSGTYFYRLLATTHARTTSRTGSMSLVK